jgi:hypothetical protein
MKRRSHRASRRRAQQQPAPTRQASEEELSRFESEGGPAKREPEQKGAPVDSRVSKTDLEQQ